MIAPDPPRCLSAPADRELRSRLYRGLVQELVSSPSRAAVVFDASTERPDPLLTVHPPQLLEPLLAAPAFRGLRSRRVAGAVPGATDRTGWTRSWALEPAHPSLPLASPPPVWDVPEALALLGCAGRIDFQTFWLSGRSDGRLWAGRRVRFRSVSPEALDLRFPAVARFTAAEWSRATGVLCRPRIVRASDREWAMASVRSMPRQGWLALGPGAAERTAEPAPLATGSGWTGDVGHTVALGASGAGKTTFLADHAAQTIRQGGAVLAIDLHGDLAPAIVARLAAGDRARVVAVDASRPPVVGVAALAGQSDRAAAQLVAAVKRLSPDGSEVYWGFRLERLFDAFVRLVQESGGSLADLYALLTDTDRRDAARLATRSPELGRFLEELGPILRRNPDFLWGAAARLAKVVLVPELAELLAPPDGGIPVEELLEEGRSVLVRIPFSALGPEAAAFAGSLVLARTYLGLAGRRGPAGLSAPIVVVLDEVQGLSPRLVAEMLTEGRKFGLRLLLASQYPERLAPELRLAAAGVSRGIVAFRVPRANAAGVGGWLGLPPTDAERILPDLPVGLGVTRATGSGELRTVPAGPAGRASAEAAWEEAAARTLGEFPAETAGVQETLDETNERLLLTVLAAEEQGVPVPRGRIADEAGRLPGPTIDRAVLDDRTATLERTGLAEVVEGSWHLTPAGERRLGLRTVTGASRESAEHRSLLCRTFRLFARHGHRLEIVRQGRYDTMLPDAVYHQIPERQRGGTPRELAEAIGSAEQGWAWRFFRGLDVHVEAEVSGALRPARIRHGLEKARGRGAYALFVVGDDARASRVRRTLRAEGVGPDRAQVWTLRGGDGHGSRDGKPPGPFRPT